MENQRFSFTEMFGISVNTDEERELLISDVQHLLDVLVGNVRDAESVLGGARKRNPEHTACAAVEWLRDAHASLSAAADKLAEFRACVESAGFRTLDNKVSVGAPERAS